MILFFYFKKWKVGEGLESFMRGKKKESRRVKVKWVMVRDFGGYFKRELVISDDKVMKVNC